MAVSEPVSDSTQVVVDVEASEDDAVPLAREILAWLSAERIIEREPSDCILGEGEGYAPGPRWGAAVAAPGDDAFLRLRTNGLRVRTGRQVFDAAGNGIELTCAGCGVTSEPGAEWFGAVGRWHEGDDGAAFTCPSCKVPRRLTDWRGPRPWGFGCLALEFWNWPPLSDSFIGVVGARLGHETVLVRAHL